MADLDSAREKPESALRAELAMLKAGMLVIDRAGQPPQSMAHFCDPGLRRIWFFADCRTEFLRAPEEFATADPTFEADEWEFHAPVEGSQWEVRDDERLIERWFSMTGGWFAGSDDPSLAQSAFVPARASCLAPTDKTIAFPWETAKADTTGAKPDVGVERDAALPASVAA